MEALQIDQEQQYVESLSSTAQKVRVKDFVWCSDEWPAIKYNDFLDDCEDIPVISLGGTQTDSAYNSTCANMVAAAQKWGFFKLIDHGVGADIVDDLTVLLNKFYDLPMEQKVKGARTGALPLGYSASNLDYGRNLPWAEILQLLQSPQQVLEFSRRVYGDQQHHEFRYVCGDMGMLLLFN